MKKMMLVMIAACIGYGASAQTNHGDGSACAAPSDTAKQENYVMMYKGKMMKIVSGTPSPLTEPVKLNNGAKVNVDGSVNLPDGKTIKIKENEMVTMSGKMSMYKAPAKDKSVSQENYVMMYKGKMMKIVSGTPSPLTEPVKLNNGAKVNVDGSVNLPDGKTIKIKENEMVTMSGKMSMYKGK
ncbi:hypothetical protein SAMN05216436_1113 [bacterium A37T11]|nr:hypothetical protein SAMN05216436_1113 [bacterium A37T11]